MFVKGTSKFGKRRSAIIVLEFLFRVKDRGSVLRLPLLESSYKAVPGSSPVVPLFSVSAPPSSNFEGVLCFFRSCEIYLF